MWLYINVNFLWPYPQNFSVKFSLFRGFLSFILKSTLTERNRNFIVDKWFRILKVWIQNHVHKTIVETFFYLLSIRILPHQQDTGGFFVAVIEKLRPLPWEAAAKTLPAEGEKVGRDDSGMDAVGSSSEDKVPWGLQRKRRRIHGYREDPFVFFTEGEPLWPSIRYPNCWKCILCIGFQIWKSHNLCLWWEKIVYH